MDNSQLNGAINTITNMLSTDEGKQNLQSIINMIGGNSQSKHDNKQQDTEVKSHHHGGQDAPNFFQMVPGLLNSPIGNFGLSMIKNFQEAYSDVQSKTKKESEFLRLLSPYLSNRRAEFVEHSIKIMQISHLPKVIKGFK